MSSSSCGLAPSEVPTTATAFLGEYMTELQQLRAEIARVQARRNRAYREFRQCDLELEELWRRVREAPLAHTGRNGRPRQCSKA